MDGCISLSNCFQYTSKPPARKHVLRSHPHMKGLATDWIHTSVNSTDQTTTGQTTSAVISTQSTTENTTQLDSNNIIVMIYSIQLGLFNIRILL